MLSNLIIADSQLISNKSMVLLITGYFHQIDCNRNNYASIRTKDHQRVIKNCPVMVGDGQYIVCCLLVGPETLDLVY